eukprot:SAG31_NODE_195_length_20708_cov_9.627638_14_plen_56_part_00
MQKFRLSSGSGPGYGDLFFKKNMYSRTSRYPDTAVSGYRTVSADTVTNFTGTRTS